MNQIIKKPKFSEFINSQVIVKSALASMNEKRRERFISSIMACVSTNPQLQECDNSTILSAALLGSSLDLSPSPQLGMFYLMPFNDRKNNRMVATFCLGYKGYLQLAMRSGVYKKINCIALKKGELISKNDLDEEYQIRLIENDDERESLETEYYYAMFEHLNGFKKSILWSKKKMESHAIKYSKGYAAKKGYTFWEKNFDEMALKTCLRQLLSKWGTMSIDMEEAYEKDMTSSNGEQAVYIDNGQDFKTENLDAIVFGEPKSE